MNNLMIFEGNNIKVIELNGEILFELYSVGMALGQSRNNNSAKSYPRKDRIDKIVKNAEISTSVHGGHKYLTESQLYDFMLELRTDKCKVFRKWVTDEVLPSIRKTGGYNVVNDTKQKKAMALLAAIENTGEGSILAIKTYTDIVIEETTAPLLETITEQGEVIEELKDSNSYLESENYRLQAVCNIPKSQLIKDIKCFINEYVKQTGTIGYKVSRDSMYEAYRFARRSRMEQPCKYTFEDILSHNCKLTKDKFGNWLDIILNEAKLKRM